MSTAEKTKVKKSKKPGEPKPESGLLASVRKAKEEKLKEEQPKKQEVSVPEKPKAEPKPQKEWKGPAKEERPAKVELKGALNTKVHRNGSAFSETRPGVCAIIIEMWRNASEKKPLPKAAVVAEILKRLPGRDPVKTKNLVGGAPSWLLTYNGIVVKSATLPEGGKGYWIPATETEEVARERMRKAREARKA